MIRHLLHLIWNQRKHNSWIIAELLLVFIVLWFVTDTLFVVGKVYFSPLGMDTDHVYNLNYKAAEEEPVETGDSASVRRILGQDVLTMVDRIRTYPGIEAVCITDNSRPFDGNGRYFNLYMTDSISHLVRRMNVTPDFFRVFKVRKAEGEKRSWEEMLAGKKHIFSSDILTWMREKGGDKDTPLYSGWKLEPTSQIEWGGTTGPLRPSQFKRDAYWLFIPLTEDEISKIDYNALTVVFRVKPENDTPDFADRFVEKMSTALWLDKAYMMDVTPYRLQVESFEMLDGTQSEIQKHMVIMGFLLFNIFLGIIGTFWFRTEQRKGEMGLRIALGSTRRNLRAIMMGEGLLMLTIVAIPAFLICLNIHLAELTYGTEWMNYTFLRFVIGFGITYLLMAIMILLGIGYPAAQTARLEPANALHYE